MKSSSTAKSVPCDQDFCQSAFSGLSSDCMAGHRCQYFITYGDGSITAGNFVRDYANFNRVRKSSNKFHEWNYSVWVSAIFCCQMRCSSQQAGQLHSSSGAVDGIVGFGQANSSIIAQLASTGKVKKLFSHCLDGRNGGGIFAIGQVVQPKLKTTPMIPNGPHYNVMMTSIDVGSEKLDLSTNVSGGGSGSSIIDSGTTLAYLPDKIYTPLMAKVMASQPDLKTHIAEGVFKCFVYTGNVDDGFPLVTFHFEDSLSLTVRPREYLLPNDENQWCFGWQNKGMLTEDGNEGALLGGSSSIKVEDELSGNVFSVGSHVLSSTCGQILW